MNENIIAMLCSRQLQELAHTTGSGSDEDDDDDDDDDDEGVLHEPG